MINCRRATRLISESQDRKLSAFENMLLKMHSAICKPCTQFEKQILDLRVMARSYAKKKNDSLDNNPKQ